MSSYLYSVLPRRAVEALLQHGHWPKGAKWERWEGALMAL